MSTSKPVIFILPLSESLVKLKETIANDQLYTIYEIDSAQEFTQLIGVIGAHLTICSDVKKLARFMSDNKATIKKNNSKALLLSKEKLPFAVTDKLQKLGLNDILYEPIVPKTLLYKVQFIAKSLKNAEKKDENTEVTIKATKQEVDKSETSLDKDAKTLQEQKKLKEKKESSQIQDEPKLDKSKVNLTFDAEEVEPSKKSKLAIEEEIIAKHKKQEENTLDLEPTKAKKEFSQIEELKNGKEKNSPFAFDPEGEKKKNQFKFEDEENLKAKNKTIESQITPDAKKEKNDLKLDDSLSLKKKEQFSLDEADSLKNKSKLDIEKEESLRKKKENLPNLEEKSNKKNATLDLGFDLDESGVRKLDPLNLENDEKKKEEKIKEAQNIENIKAKKENALPINKDKKENAKPESLDLAEDLINKAKSNFDLNDDDAIKKENKNILKKDDLPGIEKKPSAPALKEQLDKRKAQEIENAKEKNKLLAKPKLELEDNLIQDAKDKIQNDKNQKKPKDPSLQLDEELAEIDPTALNLELDDQNEKTRKGFEEKELGIKKHVSTDHFDNSSKKDRKPIAEETTLDIKKKKVDGRDDNWDYDEHGELKEKAQETFEEQTIDYGQFEEYTENIMRKASGNLGKAPKKGIDTEIEKGHGSGIDDYSTGEYKKQDNDYSMESLEKKQQADEFLAKNKNFEEQSLKNQKDEIQGFTINPITGKKYKEEKEIEDLYGEKEYREEILRKEDLYGEHELAKMTEEEIESLKKQGKAFVGEDGKLYKKTDLQLDTEEKIRHAKLTNVQEEEKKKFAKSNTGTDEEKTKTKTFNGSETEEEKNKRHQGKDQINDEITNKNPTIQNAQELKNVLPLMSEEIFNILGPPIPHNLKGAEYLYGALKILFRPDFEPSMLFNFIGDKLLNKKNGFCAFYKLENNKLELVGSSFESSIDIQTYFNESWDEYKLQRQISWKSATIPTWQDETFQSAINEFIYPYFEGDRHLGFAIFRSYSQINSEEDARFVEMLLEVARCYYLFQFEEQNKSIMTINGTTDGFFETGKKMIKAVAGIFKKFFSW